jgi:hypothetical protein
MLWPLLHDLADQAVDSPVLPGGAALILDLDAGAELHIADHHGDLPPLGSVGKGESLNHR